MRRKLLVLFLLFFSVFPCLSEIKAEQSQLIPITVAEKEQYKTKTNKERLNFMVDYYLKNKENGATDEQILNELLKLFDLTEKQAEKIYSIGKKIDYLKSSVINAVEQINLSILEKNPGRTDMLIDINQPETWKNIKNAYIGDMKINDYIKSLNLRGNSYFSETVSSENVSAVLASCADMGNENILMSFILFPHDDRFIALQDEGNPPDGIQIDFSKSENLTVEPVLFPMGKMNVVNKRNILGYEKKVYLPFRAKLKDPQISGTVRATLSVNNCQKDFCQTDVLPEITYTTEKSGLEASFCQSIVRAAGMAPDSQRARLKFEKAFFKKEKTGEVYLVASFKKPVFSPSKITSLIRNEQGLLFETPFSIQDGRKIILKASLLNPEKLKDVADITIEAGYLKVASKFNIKVSFEKVFFEKNISFFAFSISDIFTSFLSGMKFFILTPVLMAFLLLLNQSLVVLRKTPEKTLAFCSGLFKAFVLWGGLLFVLFVINACFSLFPVNWGKQFSFPLANFMFAWIFFSVALFWHKIFDDVSIEIMARRFSFLFSVFQIEYTREKAGMIAGLVCGFLLLITPLTHLYNQIGGILAESVVLYSLFFAAGVLLPFLMLALFYQKTAEIDNNPNTEKFMNLVVPVPLYQQAAILVFSVATQAGLKIFGEICVLLAVSFLFVQKNGKLWKKITLLVIAGGIFLVPFYPSDCDWNNKISDDFDENLLRQQIKDGKSVYLNVSENFCWSCLWNRFLVVYKGAPDEIKNGELSVMRISYNHPFLKRLLPSSKARTLPMNLFFSPRYPAGKIVDSHFDVWSVKKAIKEAMPIKEIVPFEQIQLEQKKPAPEEKDTD